jgi:hypothetical protein
MCVCWIRLNSRRPLRIVGLVVKQEIISVSKDNVKLRLVVTRMEKDATEAVASPGVERLAPLTVK